MWFLIKLLMQRMLHCTSHSTPVYHIPEFTIGSKPYIHRYTIISSACGTWSVAGFCPSSRWHGLRVWSWRYRELHWLPHSCGVPVLQGLLPSQPKPAAWTEGYLVAEWIHFTFFVIILPTIKLKVYTFWAQQLRRARRCARIRVLPEDFMTIIKNAWVVIASWL